MDNKPETLFEKHRENVYFRWGLTAFIVIVASVVAFQLITRLPAALAYAKQFLRILAPVLYGLVIAYLLHPIADRIEKLLKGPMGRLFPQRPKQAQGLAKGISIFASLVFALLLIWALIAMVLPQLIDSVAMIVRNMPSYYNTLSKWVMDLIDDNLEMANLTEDIMNEVYSYLSSFLKNTVLPGLETAVASLTSSVVSMAKGLLNLVIGVIISIYLLSGKTRLLAQAKKTCYAVLGSRRGGYVCNVCTYANRVFGGFIGGKLLDSLIIGILCFLGLSILDMPYTMLISIIVGVTNIIPFFGPYLGAIPSALLLLVIDPMKSLYFIIFIIVLQQVDGNIIGPVILGDATGLSSLWVVVAILVSGGLFGVFGMVIGVPLFAVLYKIVSEVINKLLEDRGLSTATADYEKWNYPPRQDSAKWNPPSRRQKKQAKKAQTQAAEIQETPPAEDEET
jgi:predicted PurR-regulated permease PerM